MNPILLLAHNASAWTGPTGNNTYLLPGAAPALIDAGIGHPAHVAAIEEALAGTALAYILITHGHPDHVTGLPVLLERWPSVRILRFPEVGDNLVAAGDGQLRAIPTPGHAPDHLCFFDEASGDLFCGDLVRAGGTIVIPASRGGNLREYLESLGRVLDLAPRRLLPGHGPIVDDPLALIEMYMRHREEREHQVVEAVRAGAKTPDEIAGRIYDSLAPALMAAAVDSVLAHLVKLREEGRAACNAGVWLLL